MCIRDSPTPRSTSGALDGLWRTRHLCEMQRGTYPSGASATKLEAISRTVQFMLRTHEAPLNFPGSVGGAR
eukprot:9626635-Alexandrium_andersonii.AAC.1